MNLNLTEVLLETGKKVSAEVPVELDSLIYSFGGFPIRKKSPAKLTVYQDEKKVLNIHGEVSLTVIIPCDRCLDPVDFPLDLVFDERVNLESESPEDTESGEAVEADSEEGAFDKDYLIQGYNLDVDKLISGEALLNWPSQVLCKPDCKGLCPVCGHNLNEGDCGCDRHQLDPRMATVLDVFKSANKEV